MKYEKCARPDKKVKLNEKRSQEQKDAAAEAKLQREVIFQQPDDERAKKGTKTEAVGDSVDAIYNPVEIRNTAEPIAFDEDGQIQEKYRQLRATGDVADSESDEDDVEDEADAVEEVYDA